MQETKQANDTGCNIKEIRTEKSRRRVLDRLAQGKVEKLSDQVAHILNHYPEARNSDKLLAIQVVKMFYSKYIDSEGKVSLDALQDLPKFYDMQRYRAKIQNDYGLFLASPKVQAYRKRLSETSRAALASEGRVASNLKIFSDESGKGGSSDKFIIIGSLWVYGQRDWEFLDRRFRDWRYVRNTTREYHFNKIGKHDIAKEALSFFQEAVFHSPFTSFNAVVIERRGIPQGRISSAVYESFAELVITGIQAEFSLRRISPPVTLQLYKDSDQDTDVLELAKMERRIDEGIRAVFSQKEAVLVNVDPLDSARYDLIQVADLYTSALNRWLNIGEPRADGNAKEYLANEIGRLMGFSMTKGKLSVTGDFCKIIYPSEHLKTVSRE